MLNVLSKGTHLYVHVPVQALVVVYSQTSDFVCRYEECKTKLTPFLKRVGFNPKTGSVTFDL